MIWGGAGVRKIEIKCTRTCLVTQWERIHLPVQETWAQSLIREDPTCRRATKPMCHNYWVCALEPRSFNCCYCCCCIALVVSDSLRPHGLQHTRLPCPSPTPRACSNSCPSSQWCHPNISISVIPFSSCFQSSPASESFPMTRLFASGGQSIGVSASTSVLPMNIQDWFPLGLTDWISLQSKGLSRIFSDTTVQNHEFFGTQFSL